MIMVIMIAAIMTLITMVRFSNTSLRVVNCKDYIQRIERYQVSHRIVVSNEHVGTGPKWGQPSLGSARREFCIAQEKLDWQATSLAATS
jgi:hypothetical protein